MRREGDNGGKNYTYHNIPTARYLQAGGNRTMGTLVSVPPHIEREQPGTQASPHATYQETREDLKRYISSKRRMTWSRKR